MGRAAQLLMSVVLNLLKNLARGAPQSFAAGCHVFPFVGLDAKGQLPVGASGIYTAHRLGEERIVKKLLQAILAGAVLLGAMATSAVAQENVSGTINTLSLDPRQNADMTNSAGTETGQPTEAGIGTINVLSLDPRQNLEMTHATGTETGQPNDVVAGSNEQENGLTPVTTTMMGSGSSGGSTSVATSSASATTRSAPATPPPSVAKATAKKSPPPAQSKPKE